MKLMVLDQISVSAVQADSLRPRQEIEVSDTLGDELLTKHPAKFRQLDEPAEPKAKAPAKAKAKAAPKPKNKALSAPPNKAAPGGDGAAE